MPNPNKFSNFADAVKKRLGVVAKEYQEPHPDAEGEAELNYHPLEIKYRMAEKQGAFLFMGSSLKQGIDRLMHEKVDEKTVAEMFIDMSQRLSKAYFLLFASLIFCLVILLLQSKQNRKQASLLTNQNLQLSKLIAKEEAEDESVFILESGKISEEISRELLTASATRSGELSAPLIGRIVAFSRMIGKDNAYNRALDGTRNETHTSPERGSLLVMLRNSELADQSYTRIYQEADFSYADLSKAKLWEANFRNINLSYANLNQTDLQDANLEEADLQHANFQGAFLLNVKMQGANLQGANLDGANLWMIDMSNTNLVDVSLVGTDMKDARLKGAKAHKRQIPVFIEAKADTTGMVWVE